MNFFNILILIVALLLATAFAIETLSEEVDATDIVFEYKNKPTNEKNFKSEVLAYVTPWNSHGYDIAKLYPKKFDFISPVWYRIEPDGKSPSGFAIVGGHDVDTNWMKDIRTNAGDWPVKIIPRFNAANWRQGDYKRFLSETNLYPLVAQAIIDEVKKFSFDGIVLEIQGAEEYLLPFVSGLSSLLKSIDPKLVFVLVIPPYRDENLGFTKNLLLEYDKAVDRFSLMTYDYSSARKPGPNSPMGWLKKNLKELTTGVDPALKKKVLLGLNFYGNDFISSGGGGPILGNQYIDLLKSKVPEISYGKQNAEHFFQYMEGGKKHIVYFPTKKSIQVRLEFAELQGVGISIWEIGQGLDYWYSLF